MHVSKRGKVLRDPQMGPGLLMVEGKQYPFGMPGVWRSDVPAKAGLVVNVDFDSQGNLHRITALPEAGFGPSGPRPSPDRGGALSQGGTVLSGRAAQFAASAALMLSWCWLTAVSIHLPSFGRSDLTFWQMLGYLNAGNLSPQISGFVTNPDSGFLLERSPCFIGRIPAPRFHGPDGLQDCRPALQFDSNPVH